MNGKALKWLIDYNVSKRHMSKLNAFYTAHLELAVDLSRAKHLGMPAISTSIKGPTSLRNPLLTTTNGKLSTTSGTPSRKEVKEMSL